MVRIAKRYQVISLLGVGGMGGVYRALDRLTGRHVALKRVELIPSPRPPTERDSGRSPGTPSSARRTFQLALAHEFRTLTTLRHPNIVSVLDYGFDSNREPFFTMELLERPRTLLQATQNTSVPEKLSLLAQLLRALIYLHRHGIIHRDLKPSNVLLVDGKQGLVVKLLDFGIASHRGSEVEVSGTLMYMAPELLAREPPSPASDLYAVGVLLHQMLFGRAPALDVGVAAAPEVSAVPADDEPTSSAEETAEETEVSDSFSLQDHSLSRRVIATVQENSQPATPASPQPLDGPLGALLRALLEPDPAQRRQDAEQVLQEISAIMQGLVGTPLPVNTAETSESILQAAVLVGRERELATLETALSETFQQRGGLVLLAGDSGVGKSRLMEELRTIALVRGMDVFRGQAISGGGTAYQPFHEALRTLALSVDIPDHEAAVLKELLPDLPNLLGREIPDAPSLAAQDSQERVRRVLLDVFCRPAAPRLLLLEDLHWAPAESRELLQALTAVLPSSPFLIVASFREGEGRDLPARFPSARHMTLPRLDPQAVLRMSQSMLGDEGISPSLLQFLVRETQGNALFIIEMLRALAEDAGGLEAIANHVLPAQISAGGIQAVVLRRLRRAPAWTHPLLKLAAVAGRRIDRRVLSFIEPQLEVWLQACTGAAILEVSDSEWRFAHDKLREALLASLAAAEESALHVRLAEAIEQVYPEGERPLVSLAQHFERGGNAARASFYASQAGSKALRSGTLHEALALLERAVILEEKAGVDALKRAATLRRLSRALLGLGRTHECAERVREAMSLLGQPLPTHKAARWVELAREAGTELRQRFLGSPRETSARRRAELGELLTLVRGSNETLFVTKGHQDEALLIMLRTLHAAERVDDQRQQINSLSWLAYAAYVAPLHSLGHFYLRRAAQLRHGAPLSIHHSGLYAMTAFISTAEGDWETALESFGRWIDVATRHGVTEQAALGHSSRAATHLLRCDLASAAADRSSCLQLGNRLQNPIYIGSGIGWDALLALRRGQIDVASQFAQEAAARVVGVRDTPTQVNAFSLLGCTAALRGDGAAAGSQLDAALDRMDRIRPAAPAYHPIYAAMLLGCLRLAELADSPTATSVAEQRIRRALANWLRFAWRFPIGWAQFFWGLGRYLVLRGQRRLALAAWRAGLPLAQRYHVRHDEALLKLWMAQLDQVPSDGVALLSAGERSQYLREALLIFEAQQAGLEIQMTQRLLAS